MNSISTRFADLWIFLIASIVALTVAHPGYAQSLESLADQIRQTYAEIDSISFSFSQTTGGQIAGRSRNGKGSAFFAREPDRHLMRWNYILPDPQVVISDGTTISMYFEKLNQMIVTSVDKARTDILFSFFIAEEPLSNYFTILPSDTEKNGSVDTSAELQVLQLQPLESDTQIKSIHLWMDKDAIIRRIELLDNFDTKTTINLSNIEINPLDLSNKQDIAKRFTFIPPDGTEIIRQ